MTFYSCPLWHTVDESWYSLCSISATHSALWTERSAAQVRALLAEQACGDTIAHLCRFAKVFATTRRLNVTHKGGLSSFSWVLLTLRFSATAEVCGRAVAEGWLRGVSSFLGSARDREESLSVC